MSSIQTFDAPALGLTLTYGTPTQKHLGHREAGQKTAPQPAYGPQVGGNKISIEVHTTGR